MGAGLTAVLLVLGEGLSYAWRRLLAMNALIIVDPRVHSDVSAWERLACKAAAGLCMTVCTGVPVLARRHTTAKRAAFSVQCS